MKVNQTFLFVILRDGIPFRHFSAQQTALNYLAACLDLFPASVWRLHVTDFANR